MLCEIVASGISLKRFAVVSVLVYISYLFCAETFINMWKNEKNARTVNHQVSSSAGADDGNISNGLSIPFSLLISANFGFRVVAVNGGRFLSNSSRSTGPSGGMSEFSMSKLLTALAGRDLADLADRILAERIRSPDSPNLEPIGVKASSLDFCSNCFPTISIGSSPSTSNESE